MIRPTSLAAFAADVTRFAGTLLAASVLADYATENRRLRAAHRDLYLENAVLHAENTALAAIADDMARQAARAQRVCDQLATAAREDAEVVAAARAVLSDAVDDVIARGEAS